MHFTQIPTGRMNGEEFDKKIGKKVYQGEEPFFTHFMNLARIRESGFGR